MGRWQPEGLTEGPIARQTTKRTVIRAKQLRREMSLPEVLLWRELKGSGAKIRKQHPAGPYVIDFYCAAMKLGFEIDGISHDMADRPAHDEERARFLETRGIKLVRIPATEVLASAVSVAEGILAMCRDRGM